MGKRSVYLIPARGTRVKTLRIPFWFVFALVFMAVAGIAGYFVPLDRLILTEQEQMQNQNISDQNERLHNNIGATLRMLSVLKERTQRLELKKEEYKDVIGLPYTPPPPEKPQRKPTAPALSAAAVVRHVDASEKLVEKFVATLGDDKRNMFDTVPVLRPISSDYSIISKQFGMGRDPFTSKQKMHYGTDLAAPEGTPVIATASGVITLVENDPVWGRRIVITHGRGFRTVYAHLGTVKVAQGRSVKRGDEIGTVGMSGLTTGPHLHYELWLRDKQLNPEEYFFPEWVVALDY
ncbi:MAG: M23 family metallopeptidase [Chitinispirillia bacterium]|nr:M23 family metallopeptidase [Chitinispirillia bacterium]MCL2269403.1 M23 family metallopeptidase [Chitinispirillia bacterium]